MGAASGLVEEGSRRYHLSVWTPQELCVRQVFLGVIYHLFLGT